MAYVASPAHVRFQLAHKLALQGGLSVVRQLLANKDTPLHDAGMTTEELYQLALQQPPPSGYYNPHIKDGVPFPPLPPPAKKGKKKEQPPGPPNPEHPVRSKAFFKRNILQYLVGTQEIVKLRSERMSESNQLFKINKKGKKVPLYLTNVGQVKHSVWVWKSIHAVDLTTIKLKPPTNKPPPIPSLPRQREPFGAEVGVGEDLSHLSKKRQKARRVEIRRDLHMMKVQAGIKAQKERAEKGAELRRLQAERAARKSQQEQDWEDRRLAARNAKRYKKN
ncbi:hypothetical protein C0995_005826 [Termitomyces sp. Mi166|nr:hypothetical protein C0995_005826 [Termitomyces sp. Mi166\